MENHTNNKYTINSDLPADNANWTFEVAPQDFDCHIRKSIPFYDQCHGLIAQISDYFLPPKAMVYDIGSTTGALVNLILARHPDKDFSIKGLDVVERMVSYANENCTDNRASFECMNAMEYDFKPANLFILNYTLQFIHPRVRIDLLHKIYQNLEWGGGLLIFEKVRAPDARFQDYMTQIYTDFKLENGFTAEQVINKQKSLKGVLEPFSEQGNLKLLTEVGFKDVVTVFKWVSFQGWLAIK